MAGKGAIWLHRQILECAEVADPLALAVWVHLLLRASHKACRLQFRGKAFAIERGQLVTSLRQLEADTKVPLQRLRTILRRFDMADMAKINTVGNTAATVVTICKYEEFQSLDASANTAINSLPTQYQHSANTQNKNGRMEEEDSESESLTESHGTPSPPARAVRSKAACPAEFEKLWLTYPRRDEDDKAGCLKLWRAAAKDHDAPSIQAAAVDWHREQRENEFRIGLRRWLKDRRFLTPPPVHRPNAGATDVIGDADRMTRDILRKMNGHDHGQEFTGAHSFVPDGPPPGVWCGPEDDGRALVLAERPVHRGPVRH